ncbi:MAG: NUDIX domain-containing protein [Candidatus Paceibacterota bacterium]|jgi:mutator protein MutT
MKRTRAVAILIREDEVLLMHRKNEKEYFTFPGGGVEEGESIEQAVLRELKEETTIEAEINKLLYRHIYDDDTEQYFYLCNYIKGEPKLHEDSIEKKQMLDGNEFYNPLWFKIEELKNMLVYPLEIRDLLLEDFKNKFSNPVNVSNIKIVELRHSI